MRQVGGQRYVYDWSHDILKYAEKCSKMSTQGGQNSAKFGLRSFWMAPYEKECITFHNINN